MAPPNFIALAFQNLLNIRVWHLFPPYLLQGLDGAIDELAILN